MTEKRKPILCLDFDGVLHSYDSGWRGATIIPDHPVPGAIDFLFDAANRFEVNIYSSRSGQEGGINAMQLWLVICIGDIAGAGAFVRETLKWPTEKPPAMVSIDDRAITFTGEWPSVDNLLKFKPWNKP